MKFATLLGAAALAASIVAAPAFAMQASTASSEMPATIDSNADGTPDAWDTNGDGRADAWDTDADGKPDSVDGDGDGQPDGQPKTK